MSLPASLVGREARRLPEPNPHRQLLYGMWRPRIHPKSMTAWTLRVHDHAVVADARRGGRTLGGAEGKPSTGGEGEAAFHALCQGHSGSQVAVDFELPSRLSTPFQT